MSKRDYLIVLHEDILEYSEEIRVFLNAADQENTDVHILQDESDKHHRRMWPKLKKDATSQLQVYTPALDVFNICHSIAAFLSDFGEKAIENLQSNLNFLELTRSNMG